jgi:type IV pilus assembly protein PilW
MMVGIAIGLFVLAGATLVATGQLADNRLLMLETQMQQDLRATADLVARELRRGGLWGNAVKTVWPGSEAPLAANPYSAAASGVGAGGRTEVTYSYSNATSTIPENDTEDASERYGFALNGSSGAVEMLIGASGWQALTDVEVINVTKFEVKPEATLVVVPCPKYCDAAGDTACWPRLTVRDASIVIEAEARHDAHVKRSVSANVRLRNDTIAVGVCPT